MSFSCWIRNRLGQFWLPLLGLIAAEVALAAAPPGGAPVTPRQISRLPHGDRLRGLLDGQEWAPAESLATAEAARVVAATPVDSVALAEALHGIVRARIGGGRFRVAGTLALADSARALRARHLGPEDPLVAESLASMARMHVMLGDLAGAIPIYQEGLRIREKIYGSEHRQVAQSLNSLGVVCAQLGDFPAARDYHRRALAMRTKLLGPEHPEVADSWNNLGYVLGETGDYVGAQDARRRVLESYEKSFGPDHPRLVTALNNLAEGYRAMGDYEESIPLHERALAIVEARGEPGRIELPQNLSNLALNLMLVGDFARARTLFERALRLREATYGPDHREVGVTLVNLAELMRLSGNAREALPLAERGVAIQEAIAPGSINVAVAQLGLANIQRDLGKLEEAEDTYARSLAVRRDVFGDEHIRVAEVRREQAVARRTAGDGAAAVRLALEAESVQRRHFRLLARVLPEREAIRFAAGTPRGLDVALNAACDAVQAGSVEGLWDAVIGSRGLILDEMATRQHTAWRTESPEVARRRTALTAANRELAHLVVQGAGGSGLVPAFRDRVTAARQACVAAERALAEASAEFRSVRARESTSLTALRAVLPPGSALVSYARFLEIDHRGLATGLRYAAFVLPDRDAPPRFLALGDSATVEGLVEAWRRAAATGAAGRPDAIARAEAECRKSGEALRRRLWDPVAGFLVGRERIFIVPDGALHLVNFAALPAAEGPPDRFLVDGTALLHVATTERDLMEADHPEPTGQGLLALGGAAFDEARGPAGPSGALRGASSPCALFRDVRFNALPGSLREVERVRALWADTQGEAAAIVLTGASATEEAVKRLAPGRRVLHLATHGFFIGRDCRPGGDAAARGIGGLVATKPGPPPPRRTAPDTAAAPATPSAEPTAGSAPPSAVPEHPLRLSGIALAGANQRGSAAPTEEDGVLTAEEIASLDLSGVEWAVLSACDTGLGDVSSGEGVFGLRRALQVAGARSVILSLWAIRDSDALRFMEALYASRLLDRRDTAASVRDACRGVLAARRRAGESTHPFYWAGFLATGDWR